MKRFFKMFIAIMAILSIFSIHVTAEPNGTTTIDINRVKIQLNGQKTDMETLFVNGTTYVPLRSIVEKLGSTLLWDAVTETANITGQKALTQTTPSPSEIKADQNTTSAKSIMYLMSIAFQIAGAFMLAQIIFLRNRKDINIVIKIANQSNVIGVGLKRLLYTGWVSKTGFGYLIIGFIIRLFYSATAFTFIANLFIVVLFGLALWVCGLWISKFFTQNQYANEYSDSRPEDAYGSSSINFLN